MTYKIINTIGEQYSEEAKKILATFGEVDFVHLTQKELEEKIGEYDIAIIGLGLNFDAALLEKASQLKIIATATTGLDHIDVAAAQQKNIEVLSLRGEEEFLNSITGTAELALGLLLDLARKISASAQSVKKYEWDREQFRGHSLSGKVLGIVGLGRLGKMMARFGQGLGMNVLAFDPLASEEIFSHSAVQKVTFEELLKQSDVISLHVHLSGETENMFHAEVFEKMKATSYLINTSRGKIVNEQDILLALEKKKIAGYATDVLSDEIHFHEQFAAHPLVEYAKAHDNLLITPHIGGMTYESREVTDIFIAKKVKKFLEAGL